MTDETIETLQENNSHLTNRNAELHADITRLNAEIITLQNRVRELEDVLNGIE